MSAQRAAVDDESRECHAVKPMCIVAPFWVELWECAIALAAYVLQHPELVRGKTVVDVGCGLGLSGIACGLAGAELAARCQRGACFCSDVCTR
jgi:predicted nicotinamide N-methyase